MTRGERGLPAAVAGLVPDLTRRQLEYWTEQGWVVPDEPGKGRPRTFSAAERMVLVLMYRLTVAGFPARTAAHVARAAVTQAGQLRAATVRVDLVPGVTVEVEVRRDADT